MKSLCARTIVAEVISYGVGRYVHRLCLVFWRNGGTFEIQKDVIFRQRASQELMTVGKNEAAQLRYWHTVYLQFLNLGPVLWAINDYRLERIVPDVAYIDAQECSYYIESFLIVHCLTSRVLEVRR